MLILTYIKRGTAAVFLAAGLAACGGTTVVYTTSSTSTTPTVTVQPTPTVTQTVAPSAPPATNLRSCGGRLFAGGVTSCPFAANVETAWRGNPSSSVVAYSPVTHLTYSLLCSTDATNEVVCTSSTRSVVEFPDAGPSAGTAGTTGTVGTTDTNSRTDPGTTSEGPGSTTHAGDAQFCSAHTCIPNFPNSNGTVVQSVDGEYSHSGGLSGA